MQKVLGFTIASVVVGVMALSGAAVADNELIGSKCETKIRCNPPLGNPCFGEKIDDNNCPNPKKRCRLVKCDKGDFFFKFCKRTGSADDECPPSGNNNTNKKCTGCKSYDCGCAQGDGDCKYTSCNCNDGGVDIDGGWEPVPACA